MSTEHDASSIPLSEPAPVDGASAVSPPESAPPSDPAAVPSAVPGEPVTQPPPADPAVADAPHVDAPRSDLSLARCAALLAERFPALFGADGPPKPIKLRIQVDIQQRAPGVFTRKALSIFLHRHTTSTAYLRALTASPHRFDLDGLPAGEIADGLIGVTGDHEGGIQGAVTEPLQPVARGDHGRAAEVGDPPPHGIEQGPAGDPVPGVGGADIDPLALDVGQGGDVAGGAGKQGQRLLMEAV